MISESQIFLLFWPSSFIFCSSNLPLTNSLPILILNSWDKGIQWPGMCGPAWVSCPNQTQSQIARAQACGRNLAAGLERRPVPREGGIRHPETYLLLGGRVWQAVRKKEKLIMCQRTWHWNTYGLSQTGNIWHTSPWSRNQCWLHKVRRRDLLCCSETGWCGSQMDHLLTVWLWTCFLTSPCFVFAYATTG